MLLILMVFLVISVNFGSTVDSSSNEAVVPIDVCEYESCPYCGGDESQVLTITDAAHMCPQSPLYGMSMMLLNILFPKLLDFVLFLR